eukprot:scaffold416571_cov36-Prasinocladus_malaysianus.AAC.1
MGGDSDLLVMGLLAERARVFVINDNQKALFQMLGPDKLEAQGPKLREDLEVFSVEKLVASWAQEPASAAFAGVNSASPLSKPLVHIIAFMPM